MGHRSQGGHGFFLLFPHGAKAAPLISIACTWLASAGSSPCSTAVTLGTFCNIWKSVWKSASVRLWSGFQFSGPRRCQDADRSFSCPSKQKVFTKQLLNNLSKLGKGGSSAGAHRLRIQGSTTCISLQDERVTFQPS